MLFCLLHLFLFPLFLFFFLFFFFLFFYFFYNFTILFSVLHLSFFSVPSSPTTLSFRFLLTFLLGGFPSFFFLFNFYFLAPLLIFWTPSSHTTREGILMNSILAFWSQCLVGFVLCAITDLPWKGIKYISQVTLNSATISLCYSVHCCHKELLGSLLSSPFLCSLLFW